MIGCWITRTPPLASIATCNPRSGRVGDNPLGNWRELISGAQPLLTRSCLVTGAMGRDSPCCTM
jgi:hypothetical protein